MREQIDSLQGLKERYVSLMLNHNWECRSKDWQVNVMSETISAIKGNGALTEFERHRLVREALKIRNAIRSGHKGRAKKYLAGFLEEIDAILVGEGISPSNLEEA